MEKIDDEKDRVNYESESEIKIDVDENKTNLLSSILTLESNRDKKTNLETVEHENYENCENENEIKNNENLTIPKNLIERKAL